MANNVYFIIPENMSLVYSTPRPSKCFYIVWFTVCLKIDFSFPLLLFWMIFDAQTRLHWIRWREYQVNRSLSRFAQHGNFNYYGNLKRLNWPDMADCLDWFPKKNVICHFSVRFELGKLRRNEWVSRAMLTELFTPGSFHFYWKCYALSGFEFQVILDSVQHQSKNMFNEKILTFKGPGKITLFKQVFSNKRSNWICKR